MAMSGQGGREAVSEINVTPLVDVMLVLLVVFMVTAPMMTAAEVELPEVSAKDVEDPAGPVSLSITKDGKLRFAGEDVKWADLKKAFVDSDDLQEKKELFIAADKSMAYGYVVTAMAVANEAGITKVQLQTDAAAQFDIGELDSKPLSPAPSGSGDEKGAP